MNIGGILCDLDGPAIDREPADSTACDAARSDFGQDVRQDFHRCPLGLSDGGAFTMPDGALETLIAGAMTTGEPK